MSRRLGALLLSTVAAGLLLAAPGVVLADCMAPPPIEQAVQTAEIVFVGTVDEVAQGNRWASVTVEEVWRGPDQPEAVVVKGGPAGNMATSVDRSFEVGVQYIFFPYVDQEQGGLADNSCTSTQPFFADLAKLRPAAVRQPAGETATTAEGFDLASLTPLLAVVGIVFVVLLGVGLLARGRSDA